MFASTHTHTHTHSGMPRTFVAKKRRHRRYQHRIMYSHRTMIRSQPRVNFYPTMSITVPTSMSKSARARAHVWAAPVAPITNCSSIRVIIRPIFWTTVYVLKDLPYRSTTVISQPNLLDRNIESLPAKSLPFVYISETRRSNECG